MLTPAQRRTLEALRRTDGAPRVFDPTFVAGLRADAGAAIAELTDRLDDDRSLAVNKFSVAEVLSCERHFLEPAPFAWSTAIACGKVAHRSIELLLNWRGSWTPADLVDDALTRLVEDDNSLGEWLTTLPQGAQADLRSRAVARVTQFVECFPPLRRSWHPVTEAQVRWPLGGPITLRAKADIVIGRPEGDEARKVLIDLKSGGITHRHREDLRYYALVETLVREVPPRVVASFSLEAGDAVVEVVTEGMLRSSLRRTLDAIDRMIELQVEERPPRPEPSAGCYRCRELAPLAVVSTAVVRDGIVVSGGHGAGEQHADAA